MMALSSHLRVPHNHSPSAFHVLSIPAIYAFLSYLGLTHSRLLVLEHRRPLGPRVCSEHLSLKAIY